MTVVVNDEYFGTTGRLREVSGDAANIHSESGGRSTVAFRRGNRRHRRRRRQQRQRKKAGGFFSY